MSYRSQTKFNNLNTRQKATADKISDLLSQLNAHAMDALKQQAYLRANPDLNIDQEYIDILGVAIDPIIVTFTEVVGKLQDVVASSNATVTVDSIITKYNIDLVKVSNDLL